MGSRAISLVICLLIVGSTAPIAFAADYQITASDTTPMPERTVDFQGDTYTLDDTIRASPGSSISLDVSAPDEVYRVYIYNSNEQIVADERGEGSGSFSFDLSQYEPGSYVVSTQHRGDYTALQPLVVSGYDVSVQAPSSTQVDDTFDVTVDVTQTAATSAPASVQVVVADGESERTVEATGSDGTYTATIDAESLSTGEQTVYGIVQGDEQAFGQREILGVSDRQSLTIESGGDNPESGNSDDSESDSPDDPDSESTQNTTETTTSSNATETTSSDSSTEDDRFGENSSQSTTETTSETATASPTATATSTEIDVLTTGETTTGESTSGSGPGFGITGALVAIMIVALFGHRQR